MLTAGYGAGHELAAYATKEYCHQHGLANVQIIDLMKEAYPLLNDGPDPEFTPQLLDLLSNYQIKATFFVLGAKAEKYPDIILRIHHESHLIGIHNYVHWTNALMTPGKTSCLSLKDSQLCAFCKSHLQDNLICSMFNFR